MKIDNTSKSPGSASIRETPERPIRKTADDLRAVPQSTRVQISPLSAQLQSIQRGFADTPVVDAARVAALKEAISSGHFKVNADKVAAHLLETVQALIAAQK